MTVAFVIKGIGKMTAVNCMETFFNNMTVEEGTKEKLFQDLRVLMHDAEQLVRVCGEDVAGKSKEQLSVLMEKMKLTCTKLEEQAASGARHMDVLIRQNPYPFVGAAFGLGVLLGLLGKRDR